MISYQHFAYIYDELMTDAPYENWLTYIERNIAMYGNGQKTLLDLGCGTGSLSIPLASRGYHVTGIDLSEEMLAVALAKSQEAGVSVAFFQQDMRELMGLTSFDIIGIFCDALNYVRTEKDVQRTFLNIYDLLSPGGLLLFDVHSIYKMKEIFCGQTYSSNDEDVSYIWNCYEGNEENAVEHELTFFVKQQNSYQRFDEVHYQRAFPVESYKKWLEQTGFRILSITADFTDAAPDEKSERIFFVAKK